MLNSFYPGSTLIVMLFLGVLWGQLLMAWWLYLPWVISRQRRARRREAALAALRRFVEEVIVSERKQHEGRQTGISIAQFSALGAAEAIEEDRMLCTVCWKERHPGSLWPFSAISQDALCKAHTEAQPETDEALEEVFCSLVG